MRVLVALTWGLMAPLAAELISRSSELKGLARPAVRSDEVQDARKLLSLRVSAAAPAPYASEERVPEEVWMGYHRYHANEYFRRYDHWSTKEVMAGGYGLAFGPQKVPLQPYNVKPEHPASRGSGQHTIWDYLPARLYR